ncbi:MAG: PAS domain-containing protein [Thermodesulfobacteriota bacterium]
MLSAIFWIIEAAMHVYIFHDGTFLQQLLSPETHEAWMRLIVVGMFIAFSMYVESIINVRRRAEEATRQAYSELNQVLDTAADGMRLVDKDFNILRVNETFSVLSGIGKDEATGKKCHEVFRGPLCHSPACPLTRILQGEERVECDVEKERCDGTTVPCILTATPFLTNDGRLIGIVEDFKDITDRKRMEAAMRESERQKQIILDASVDVIVQVDTEMRIVWANKTAGSIVNINPENLIGHTCHKVYQNSDTPCPDCPCKKALESGQIEHGIKYQPAMNVVGESYWEDYGVPLKNESGEVVGLIEIARNVTEKMKAEKALRESEEKLAGIVDSITDLMIMVDEHFNILWANDHAVNFCPRDLVGGKCYTAYHKKNATCASCIVKECFTDGEVHEFQTEIVGADGKMRVFWGTASVAARYEDGRPMAVVEYLRDITDRIQAERDIKLLKQKMEFILGATKTGLDIIDSQFNIRYIDPEWEKFYGDHTGKKCYEYFMGRNETCPGCGIPEALKTKAITVTEEILVKENNRPVQVTTIPFQDEKGEWLVAEVNVDITERKAAEKRLAKQTAELQHLSLRLVETEESNRRSITRELHDKLGQQLTALAINLHIMGKSALRAQDPSLNRRLSDSLVLLDEMTGHVRDIMAELRPPVLDDYGLDATLRWYGNLFSQRTGIKVEVFAHDLPRFSMAIELALFRVAQEALINVAKHSGAQEVEIHCLVDQGILQLEITDNGKGITPPADNGDGGSGMGLISMRERMRAFGGSLRIESFPGGGVSVVAEVRL